MKLLMPSFPREIGFPWRTLIYNKYDFYDIVNKYNGKKTLFYSLYKKIDNNIIECDKIFFDFDGEDSIYDIRKLHKYCLEKDIKHIMFFSGGGFHCYIFCKKQQIDSNKLNAVHTYFIKRLNINIDKHIVGDISRVSRIPNTYNIKRQRYCIPAMTEDLREGFNYLKEKAIKQRFEYKIYGKKILNLNYFKKRDYFKNIVKISYKIDVFNEIQIDSKIKTNIIYQCLRPCVQKLCVPEARWRARFHIITEIQNNGFSLSQCIAFLKSFLSEKKFKHSVIIERQPVYIYKHTDFQKTSCDILKKETKCLIICNKEG